MTLSLYLARRFVTVFMIVFSGFFLLIFLLQMIEEIRRFSDTSPGLPALAELAFFNTPQSVYRILPMITVLASIALFVAMARSSELVVIRAAGRSALRMLMPPVIATLVIGALAVAALNPIVASLTKRYELRSNEFRLADANVLSVTREGLWLRQGGPVGPTVIHAARSNFDGTELSDVTFIAIAANGAPYGRVDAGKARLTPGAWELTDAKEWQFVPGTNPEMSARNFPDYRLASDLTVEQIRDSFGTPATVPIWDLPEFIAGLERAGFSAQKHLVWMQMELALPLLLAVMVLLGAGFTMHHARSGQTGIRVILAVGCGFAIFLLRNFAQVLGENGQIPVLVAAWGPPVAALLLSVTLLLHLEDG